MLKKAGIFVGVIAAGVLAVTPLAFAHGSAPSSSDINIEEGNQTNDCTFDQAGSDVDQHVIGGSSLLGALGAVTGAAAPVTTQAQALNCTNLNIEDIADLNSGNTTSDTTETEIDDSFNGGGDDD